MPLETTASAACLIRSSLTLQANLFQLFQPIGGVRASPLSSACILLAARRQRVARVRVMRVIRPVGAFVFMSFDYHIAAAGGAPAAVETSLDTARTSACATVARTSACEPLADQEVGDAAGEFAIGRAQ